jgi:hypothetical protein
MNMHQEFWTLYGREDHAALATWAAACAEHVLPFFTGVRPDDPRPEQALTTLWEWIVTGRFSMAVIRGASLAAHAAAREVAASDSAACFAARAAGQAVATAHVPTHALGPALYAIKAVAAANPADIERAVFAELEWQDCCLPPNLRDWVHAKMRGGERLLPKELRRFLPQPSTWR